LRYVRLRQNRKDPIANPVREIRLCLAPPPQFWSPTQTAVRGLSCAWSLPVTRQHPYSAGEAAMYGVSARRPPCLASCSNAYLKCGVQLTDGPRTYL